MTSEFDTLLANSASDFTDTFGETVTYYPASGGSREITAVVKRQPPEILEGSIRGHSPVLIVFVENDATTGIASTEIDIGGDEIQVPLRVGDTSSRRRITQIRNQDAGMLELELR